jgi:hypothetical protein
MNNNEKKNAWMKEYTEFAEEAAESTAVPEGLLKSLQGRLFPNPWKVFGKVAGIHAVVGFLSLGICNQFGLNPFQTQSSLSDFFMKAAGHQFCMFACGVFFVATTYIMANAFLTLEELETLRKKEGLQTGVLALASIAGFYFLGAELVGAFVALWMIGAFVGGWVSIEGSFFFRRQLS